MYGKHRMYLNTKTVCHYIWVLKNLFLQITANWLQKVVSLQYHNIPLISDKMTLQSLCENESFKQKILFEAPFNSKGSLPKKMS